MLWVRTKNHLDRDVIRLHSQFPIHRRYFFVLFSPPDLLPILIFSLIKPPLSMETHVW